MRLLLVLAGLLSLSTSVLARSCQNESNMAMLSDPYDSSVYYLCVYGRTEKFYCPPGLRFDSRKPACVPKRTARAQRSLLRREKRNVFDDPKIYKEFLRDALVLRNWLSLDE